MHAMLLVLQSEIATTRRAWLALVPGWSQSKKLGKATCGWACSGPPDEGIQQKARLQGRSPEEIRGDRQSKAHPAEALIAVDVAIS